MLRYSLNPMRLKLIGVVALAIVGLISIAYALIQGEIWTAGLVLGNLVLFLVNVCWFWRNRRVGVPDARE